MNNHRGGTATIKIHSINCSKLEQEISQHFKRHARTDSRLASIHSDQQNSSRFQLRDRGSRMAILGETCSHPFLLVGNRNLSRLDKLRTAAEYAVNAQPISIITRFNRV